MSRKYPKNRRNGSRSLSIKIQENVIHTNHTEYNVNYNKYKQLKLAVPNDKKDEFVKKYKRFHDINSIADVVVMGVGSGIGAILGNKIVSKLSKAPSSELKKLGVGIISAIISGFAALSASAIITNSLDLNLRNKYNAKIIKENDKPQEV